MRTLRIAGLVLFTLLGGAAIAAADDLPKAKTPKECIDLMNARAAAGDLAGYARYIAEPIGSRMAKILPSLQTMFESRKKLAAAADAKLGAGAAAAAQIDLEDDDPAPHMALTPLDVKEEGDKAKVQAKMGKDADVETYTFVKVDGAWYLDMKSMPGFSEADLGDMEKQLSLMQAAIAATDELAGEVREGKVASKEELKKRLDRIQAELLKPASHE